MNEENTLVLEQESEAPENWETDTILVRDGKGNIVEIGVPDDKEE